jgi:hypothetical protein
MDIINRDWRKIYAEVVAYILLDTAVLTLFLRIMLRKDHLAKILALAFGISLVSVFTFKGLYVLAKKDRLHEVDESIFFFLAGIHLYILAVGSIAAILKLV